jgi:hypothetical protein
MQIDVFANLTTKSQEENFGYNSSHDLKITIWTTACVFAAEQVLRI